LSKDYADKDVQVLVIDVKEPKATVSAWAEKVAFTFPVLLDEDGSVAATYAPEGILPDLVRDQVPIASNIIIDKDGKIQFYLLLDSRNFDAKLIALKAKLNGLLAAAE
jgi:peroxiredoxin